MQLSVQECLTEGKKQPFLNKAALKSSCDWFTLTSSAFRYSVKGKSLRDEDNYVRLTYMFKFNDLMQLLKAATITAQFYSSIADKQLLNCYSEYVNSLENRADFLFCIFHTHKHYKNQNQQKISTYFKTFIQHNLFLFLVIFLIPHQSIKYILFYYRSILYPSTQVLALLYLQRNGIVRYNLCLCVIWKTAAKIKNQRNKQPPDLKKKRIKANCCLHSGS